MLSPLKDYFGSAEHESRALPGVLGSNPGGQDPQRPGPLRELPRLSPEKRKRRVSDTNLQPFPARLFNRHATARREILLKMGTLATSDSLRVIRLNRGVFVLSEHLTAYDGCTA